MGVYLLHLRSMSRALLANAIIQSEKERSCGPNPHEFSFLGKIRMIRKITIQNFKKFEHLTFELPDQLILVSPNNGGKTSVLQAISTWFELANFWLTPEQIFTENIELSRDANEEYQFKSLNLNDFSSAPLHDYEHLWTGKNVQEHASVELETERWRVKFEIIFEQAEMARIRPHKNVLENDLDTLKSELTSDSRFDVIFVRSLSGLEQREPFRDQKFINHQLAKGQAGTVLRNLIVQVSQDPLNWQYLCQIVKNLFGYILLQPSIPSGAYYHIYYQHRVEDQRYELVSAADGFLQVLLVLVTLLCRPSSLVLLDEPDAHLHILLQQRIYQELSRVAKRQHTQLLVSTHSEQLINAASADELRVIAHDELVRLKHPRSAKNLMILDSTDVMNAELYGKVIYVEGKTDIPLLRVWSHTLSHNMSSTLENPFSIETAENKIKALTHFRSLQYLVPRIRAVYLRDSDNKPHAPEGEKPNGLLNLFWKNFEIESYLLHPSSIIRYLETKVDEKALKRATEFMEEQVPRAVFESPFDTSYLGKERTKSLLYDILMIAGLPKEFNTVLDFAQHMDVEEIHPEVTEKLDKMLNHLNQ